MQTQKPEIEAVQLLYKERERESVRVSEWKTKKQIELVTALCN